MDQRRQIAVLTRSPLWKACLQRELNRADISWALDIDSLLGDVASESWDAVIVELDSNSVIQDCQKIHQHAQDAYPTRFFSVGDHSLRRWLPLILVCGFADCCREVGALPKLAAKIFLDEITQLSKQNETIESRVSAGLPWKAVNE